MHHARNMDPEKINQSIFNTFSTLQAVSLLFKKNFAKYQASQFQFYLTKVSLIYAEILQHKQITEIYSIEKDYSSALGSIYSHYEF